MVNANKEQYDRHLNVYKDNLAISNNKYNLVDFRNARGGAWGGARGGARGGAASPEYACLYFLFHMWHQSWMWIKTVKVDIFHWKYKVSLL